MALVPEDFVQVRGEIAPEWLPDAEDVISGLIEQVPSGTADEIAIAFVYAKAYERVIGYTTMNRPQRSVIGPLSETWGEDSIKWLNDRYLYWATKTDGLIEIAFDGPRVGGAVVTEVAL